MVVARCTLTRRSWAESAVGCIAEETQLPGLSYTQLPDSTYLDFNSYGSDADALSGGTPVHNFTINVALVMVPHVGTHGIRHRATTEIANSGVPVKVGMQLTAHKTVTQFMRYVHTEDDPVRAAAETVASRRLVVLSGQRTSTLAQRF
jgi:hypothetical protein